MHCAVAVMRMILLQYHARQHPRFLHPHGVGPLWTVHKVALTAHTTKSCHQKLSGKAQEERWSGATLTMRSMPLSSWCQCGIDCNSSLIGLLIASVHSATPLDGRLCQHSNHHTAPALGLSPGIHQIVMILTCDPVLECRWYGPMHVTFQLV